MALNVNRSRKNLKNGSGAVYVGITYLTFRGFRYWFQSVIFSLVLILLSGA